LIREERVHWVVEDDDRGLTCQLAFARVRVTHRIRQRNVNIIASQLSVERNRHASIDQVVALQLINYRVI
jgi:hypothetical protein